MSDTPPLPDDVSATWDLDGCTLRLPGPGTTLREAAVAWVGLMALGGVLLPPMALWQGESMAYALTMGGFGAAAMGLVVPVFLALGGVARRNGGVTMRIEPRGDVTYLSFGMEEPLRVRTAAIDRIEVPEVGAARVVVHAGRARHSFVVRERDHAVAVAGLLERARPPAPRGEAVPDALRALRARQPEG